MKIEIEDLKKVKLKKGDVLLLTVDAEIADSEITESLKILHDIFPKNEILVDTKEIKISVISKEK